MVAADSDSCACIFSPHHFEPTIELAARDCLAGGTDIDSGTTYSSHLANALANSSVLPSRTTVDQALHNTYAMRMRMGGKPSPKAAQSSLVTARWVSTAAMAAVAVS